MKNIGTLVLLLVLLGIAPSIHAQDYKMGIGVRISNSAPVINNSISFKYFLGQTTALEALFSFGDPLGVGILAEKHKPALASNFQLFYGVGGFVGFGGTRRAGLQGV